MAAEQRSVKLAISYFEDFDISSEEQKYHALKVRVLKAITEAVAEERERCAKIADDEAASCTHDPAEFCEMFGCQTLRGIAAAIRKVKP